MKTQPRTRVSGRFLAASALGAVWALFAGPDLLFPINPFTRDTAITYLPLRVDFANRLRHGELAQWCPNIGLGESCIGQIVTATFHPQSLLYLFLPPVLALKWTVYLCVLAALVGAYRFARVVGASRPGAFGAAVGYGLCGYSLSMINNLPYLCGVATFPWVGWAAASFLRKRKGSHVALLGLFWSLIFLGGDAHGAAMAGVVVLVVWVALAGNRYALVGLAVAGGSALLLSGIELGPALAVARESYRAAQKGNVAFATQWSFPFWRFPDLIAPCIVSDHQLSLAAASFWSRSVFLGTLVVLAVACGLLARDGRSARRSLAFVSLAVVSVWMAMGEQGGLLVVLVRIFPVLGMFRYSEKYLVLLSLSLIPLSAAGFDWLSRHPKKGAMTAGIAGIAVLGLATLCSGTWIVDALVSPEAPAGPLTALVRAWGSGFRASGVILLAAAVLVLAARAAHWPVAPIFPALAAFELLRAGVGIFPAIPDSVFKEVSPFAAPILAAAEPPGPPPRLAQGDQPVIDTTAEDAEVKVLRAHRFSLSPLEATAYGLDQFASDLPSARYAAVLGITSSGAIAGAPYFNGCFLLLKGGESAPPGSVSVMEDAWRGFTLYRRPCAPRASLVQALSAPDESAALAMIASEVPLGSVVWEGAAPRERVDGSVRWLESTPEHLRLDVTAAGPAALYVADAFASGWTAEVDGHPATIHPANVAARGVEVPPGHHTVSMQFKVPYLLPGAIASMLGLLLLVVLCLLPSALTGRLFQGTGPAIPVG